MPSRYGADQDTNNGRFCPFSPRVPCLDQRPL